MILLTNKECPWRCLMCDLWKNTTAQTVPPGAIPAQIEHALKALSSRWLEDKSGCPAPAVDQIKLYNSGSFFDPAAIPTADYPAIAGKVSFAEHVIVESHPRLIGQTAVRLRDLLGGSLEVAMGLETVHPEILPRLNKKFSLIHFTQAAEFLRSNGIAMRAFVLVQPPYMREVESVDWAVRSVEFAISCGATAVSLIPTRGGNGAMDRLAEAGEFAPPRLATLERTLELALRLRGGRVLADTWDLQRCSTCALCFAPRTERLRKMNLTQQVLPVVACSSCGG